MAHAALLLRHGHGKRRIFRIAEQAHGVRTILRIGAAGQGRAVGRVYPRLAVGRKPLRLHPAAPAVSVIGNAGDFVKIRRKACVNLQRERLRHGLPLRKAKGARHFKDTVPKRAHAVRSGRTGAQLSHGPPVPKEAPVFKAIGVHGYINPPLIHAPATAPGIRRGSCP